MLNSLKVHSLSGSVFIIPTSPNTILIQSFCRGNVINSMHDISNNINVPRDYEIKVNY